MTGGGQAGGPSGERGPAELQHPRFARAYARAVEEMNRRGATEHRRELLAGLHGSVVEIGAGDGSAFALYPPAVTRVLAIEPDDDLRSIAAAKAASAPVPVTVRAGAAEHIPAADASVDAVVSSLVLCSVGEQAPVLAEIRRVLRPGGSLLFTSTYARTTGCSRQWRTFWRLHGSGSPADAIQTGTLWRPSGRLALFR
nr:hypothetical protein GCM10017547_27200 [Pseudarthrobacter oxydans]